MAFSERYNPQQGPYSSGQGYQAPNKFTWQPINSASSSSPFSNTAPAKSSYFGDGGVFGNTNTSSNLSTPLSNAPINGTSISTPGANGQPGFSSNAMSNANYDGPLEYTDIDVPEGGGGFDFGLNQGTLQLGTAAFNAYNGWQANKAASERNDIARTELAQNAKSFDVNAGMQLATLQNEETRRNAYAGGFLDNSQRSDRFKDYDLQKLSVA